MLIRHCAASILALVLQGAWVFPATAAPATVNDVTLINPISVDEIVIPRTVEEVREFVLTHRGPISIGGGHFSMGGQTASEHTLHLDMRGLNRIVAYSPATKTITVEAGITWRAIQETVDHDNLAVKIMQSYANFTVGGSLSVNVHGRYVGQGPLIGSVKGIKVVLADGQLVEATPTQRSEIFFGCIGGYGGLGVIVEATLELAENQKVERSVQTMPVNQYKDFFFRTIKPSTTAIFHNGDIYPPAYDEVLSITWSATDKPVTVGERLPPIQRHYWFDQLTYYWLSELPLGKWFRQSIFDPLRFRGNEIVWRNYEASYDVRQLEPRSRETSTYVLQEYFIPVGRFDEFLPKMAEIFTRYDVNIMNVSIRHANPDQGSLLAWAREEVFAFVVYYKQGTAQHEKTTVGVWTREMINVILSVGGTYYLPYQIHATDEQFQRAYPRAKEWFALKQRLDPDNRFRNKLWDRYYQPPATTPISTATLTPTATSTSRQDVKKNSRP
ncbi:FAD-binding oxidoreductase [Candidatus Nitrospira neomarina]|uniref:FAD-binding oxidoreductase n=1 Tax=Candidatus Nitrospira neomarina TaxID=3020899 RepID=A0AA96JVM6_9BACT|nr:FAD-binding oxidoreductase [Candidatus Nitrospira neomarina]WNM61872.1 FAD-binding oxidoreductase [Candidatus Nitrospira neomarina]